jgi:hypothetical protein
LQSATEITAAIGTRHDHLASGRSGVDEKVQKSRLLKVTLCSCLGV